MGQVREGCAGVAERFLLGGKEAADRWRRSQAPAAAAPTPQDADEAEPIPVLPLHLRGMPLGDTPLQVFEILCGCLQPEPAAGAAKRPALFRLLFHHEHEHIFEVSRPTLGFGILAFARG